MNETIKELENEITELNKLIVNISTNSSAFILSQREVLIERRNQLRKQLVELESEEQQSKVDSKEQFKTISDLINQLKPEFLVVEITEPENKPDNKSTFQTILNEITESQKRAAPKCKLQDKLEKLQKEVNELKNNQKTASVKEITFDEFYHYVITSSIPPKLREGQFIYSELFKTKPKLCDFLERNGYNIFKMQNINTKTWSFIREHWDKKL